MIKKLPWRNECWIAEMPADTYFQYQIPNVDVENIKGILKYRLKIHFKIIKTKQNYESWCERTLSLMYNQKTNEN